MRFFKLNDDDEREYPNHIYFRVEFYIDGTFLYRSNNGRYCSDKYYLIL